MTSIWYKWLSHENSSVISSSNSILHGRCVFSAEHLHLSVTVSWWWHLVNRCKVTDMLVATHYRLVIMATLRSRCRHYIFALWFLSFYLLFSSPNLSGCRLDVYHTFTHGVALVRIQNAGLKCAARGSLEIQDTFWHHRTTLLGYIFGTKACIYNRKKLVKHQYLLHMSW